MKLRTITLFAGLLVAQVSLAQVDEMGTMTDTTIPVVTNVEQTTSEADLKLKKNSLKHNKNYKKNKKKR